MICLFATSATIAQDGGWEWLLAAGRNNNDWSNSLVKDADDNLYITGAFTHTAIFGKDTLGNTVTLTSLPSTLERFVAKYNKRGECLWVKSVYRITANNSNRKGSIAIDTLGNLFVGGTAYGDVINGTDTLFKYERGVHAFISSFSSEDGSSKWIRMSGSNAFRTNLSGDTLGIHDAYCFSVEADNQGGVYTTGMFNNEMFIDTSANGSTYVEGGAITSYAVFLLKYDSIGNLLWNSFIKPQNNNWSIFSNAVRINSTGDVFIAGTTYDRQFVYDATNQLVDSMYTNPYATVTNIYILQFNQNGEYIRQNLYERNNRQYSNSMFIDQEDNIFLCGRFLSSLSFNEDTVTALKGLYDVFILKITPDSIGTDGNFNIVWANYILGIGGSQSETTGNIIANDNFVYLTGYFTDTTYFTPTDFAINDSLRDIYIAKYDKENGTFQFALQAGGTLYDEGWGIAVDDCENIYATGYFTSPAYFEDDTLTGLSYREIFLGKYNVHYTDFIPDILICPNTQITITATNLAPSQYVLSWSNTVTLIDSITVSPTTTTTYTLTVSDTEGCTASDQAIITVREVTALTWEGDTTNQFGEITTTSYSHDQTPNPPAIAVPLNPDNDWFIATNWTCDILPDSTWDVIIPSNPIGGDTVFPVIDRSGGTSTFIAKCKNITIENGAKLTITNNDNIDTQENPRWNDASILQVYGDWNNQNATELMLGEGEVSFRGDSSFQYIYGPNRWGNLEMRNDSGLIIDSTYMQNLTGIFYQTKGTLHTNNKLTLISDHTKTALIDGGDRDGSPLSDNNIVGDITVQRFVLQSTALPGVDEVHYMGCPMKDFLYSDYAQAFGHTIVPGSWGNMYYNAIYGVPKATFDYHLNIYHDTVQKAYTYDHASPPYTEAERLAWNGWGVPYNTTIPPLLGLSMNFMGQDASNTTPYQLTGNVNNDTAYTINWTHTEKTYKVPYYNLYTEGHEGWMLFGNPYPCPIDWQQVDSADRAGFDNAVYFMDPYTDTTQDSQDMYGRVRFWVAGMCTGAFKEHINYTGPPDPTDTTYWYPFDDVSSIIPSMQGVILKTSHIDSIQAPQPSPNIPLTIRATAKTRNLSPRPYSDNRHFYKSNQYIKKIRIEAIADNFFVDGLLVYANKNATTGFDRQYDAVKFMNKGKNYANLHIIGSDSMSMAINAMPEENMKSFKVGFTAHKEGIYKIRRRRLENYTNATLQVIDHLTNDTSYLYKDKEYIAFHYDSIIERHFTINIVEDTGNNEPIHYATDTINDNSKSKKNYQKLLNPILRCYPNPTNQAINIEYELASSSSKLDKRFDVSLKVYNSYGTLIQEIVNEKQNAGKKLYTFDLPNNGMYIARLIIDNKTFKQIIIKQ